MVLIFSVFTIIYLLIVIKLFFSWKNIDNAIETHSPLPEPLFFSVIIPVRNESGNILNLLGDLNAQTLESEKFEVVIVDDDSSDGTYELIKRHQFDFKFSLTLLKLEVESNFKGSFKKKALTLGVLNSNGNYIVTTDGDCRVTEKWLSSLNNFLNRSYAECVTGPVTFKEGSLFQNMQTLEFAFLIATGAASLNIKFPNMCNGANLAFSKKAFFEVNGYEGNAHIPSGDDEFLMHKIYKRFPQKVRFLKDNEFTVLTIAKETIQSLFFQRRRWAGKWSMYSDKKISLFAAFYFVYNLIFIISLIMVILDAFPLGIFFTLVFSKIILNFIFLKTTLNFLKKKLFIPIFILTEMIYPFYIAILGIASNFGHYEWKGRKI